LGRVLSARLARIAVRLREAGESWSGKVRALEQAVVAASQSFSAATPGVSSVLLCGMADLPTTQQVDCITVYRGLHFRQDYFSDFDILNQTLASLDQIPASSEQVRRRADVQPGLVESQAQMDQLEQEADDIAHTLRAQEGKNVKQHWSKNTGDQYYSLIQRYINAYGSFSTEIGQENKRPALYAGLDMTLTPFVSFSFNPVHSIRYVLGLKTPEEQSDQRRRQGNLGELYIYLIPLVPANILRLNNVLKLQREKKFKIHPHIINGAEVNVLGGMSSANLVGRLIVGAVGFDFYAKDEKVTTATAMAQAKLNQWQEELAARAIGCAMSEAQRLGWKIVGYENFPAITRSDLADPYFGVSKMPTKAARLTASQKLAIQARLRQTRQITAANKAFSSVGGAASHLAWDAPPSASASGAQLDMDEDNMEDSAAAAAAGSGDLLFEKLNEPAYPESVDDFLEQQGVVEQDPTLAALFERFNEGQATPEENNCLIHTLAQLRARNPATLPDFVQVRARYGIAHGATIDLGDHGHQIAFDLGLHVTVFALGYRGLVQEMGAIGLMDGQKCAIFQFGAHFIPLWPKQGM
jgi:hypothetical protein